MTSIFNNYNGAIIPADRQILTTNNRGFHYGDGLFESMRMINGHLQLAGLHAARLQEGMKLLKLDGKAQLDEYFLKEKAHELSLRNRAKNGRLRLTVFRDAEGLYSPVNNKSGFCLEWANLDEQQYSLNAKGLIMDIYADIPKAINALSNLKHCNALLYVLAGIFKQQNRLHEAFLLNQNGFLCESISANIFIRFDGKLYTPALSEGCVGGVMRQHIINIAGKNSIEVIEAQINPKILDQANEVFLTNATRGIQWVLGFNKKRYFNEMSKFLSVLLNQQIQHS